MRILIIGATGFIGRKLARELFSAGHEVTGLTRNPSIDGQHFHENMTLSLWDGKSIDGLKRLLEGKDAVVNLAGKSLASGIWTENRKKVLFSSRAGIGRILSEAIMHMENRPSCLIQGSATGYYGRLAEGTTDETAPKGPGFLADLADQWEASVSNLAGTGVRTILIRTGVVLGRDGGLMKKLLLPFNFYFGTILGSGNQWISWIHMEDQVRAINFLLNNPQSSGPYNLASPEPATMREMIAEIGKLTGKPAWFRIPGGLLKMVLGEMASETILASQRIYPAKLQNEGFSFKYPTIDLALVDLLSKPK